MSPAETTQRQEFAAMLVRQFARPAADAYRRPASRRRVADYMTYYEVWELARAVTAGRVPIDIDLKPEHRQPEQASHV
jgi:hypothetical protein